ncbi:MAG: pyrroline-5-carboxylate reductase [Eggerthellaceae bacterium]|nr:pyrroline-5-carboxylate reductase [Eggerthellaceae bacterium]
MTTYGFIGVGNMGGALARACAKAGGDTQILLSNRTAAKAEALAAELGAQAVPVADVAEKADVIILGVKPQNLADLFADIAPVLAARETAPVLVTMAAGRTITQIRALAGPRADGATYPIIRIMPNLPVSIGEGVTLICADGVADCSFAAFVNDFAAAGQFIPLPESQFDAGMAISGCAPAFAFMFADALAKGGEAAGLSRETALALAIDTMRGSAALLAADPRTPAELTRAVCSPGGTTIEGVEALRAGGFDALVQSAVRASYEKASRM